MQPFDYLVILDFEATCDDKQRPDPQEVIEFPSVLMRTDTFETIDEFSTFVRPIHNPTLTPFCTELTSITQDDVDGAPTFGEVLTQHLEWLSSHGLSIDGGQTGEAFSIVLCGDWDLGTMFPAQCKHNTPVIDEIPPPYRQWINIKVPFAQAHNTKKAPGMAGMLKRLKLPLVGHHHRGIDDCRNIAAIAEALIKRGTQLDTTSRLAPSRYPVLPLILQKGDTQHHVELTKRALPTLIGLAQGAFRQNVRKFHTKTGEVINQDALFALSPNTTIIVS